MPAVEGSGGESLQLALDPNHHGAVLLTVRNEEGKRGDEDDPYILDVTVDPLQLREALDTILQQPAK